MTVLNVLTVVLLVVALVQGGLFLSKISQLEAYCQHLRGQILMLEKELAVAVHGVPVQGNGGGGGGGGGGYARGGIYANGGPLQSPPCDCPEECVCGVGPYIRCLEGAGDWSEEQRTTVGQVVDALGLS